MLCPFCSYFEKWHAALLYLTCASRRWLAAAEYHSLCGKGWHAPGSATRKPALSNCCSYSLAFCANCTDVVDVSVDAAKRLAAACLTQQDCWQPECSTTSNEQITFWDRPKRPGGMHTMCAWEFKFGSCWHWLGFTLHQRHEEGKCALWLRRVLWKARWYICSHSRLWAAACEV